MRNLRAHPRRRVAPFLAKGDTLIRRLPSGRCRFVPLVSRPRTQLPLVRAVAGGSRSASARFQTSLRAVRVAPERVHLDLAP